MERCSFFNAELNGETYDRVYLAEDFARYFASFIGNGVFPNPATGLQVIADNKSMNVIVRKGKAWINGYFYENTNDLILQVNVADGVLNRIDRVVLRLDFLNREIKVYVKQGDFASVPAVPTLTRNSDIYELALADIRINKGTIKISQVAITDLRPNKELCGFVRGTVEEIDTTGLFAQFEKGFEAWFEHMKDTIEGDAAANLTNKVYYLKKDFDVIAKKTNEMHDSKGTSNGIATLNDKGRLAQNIDVSKIIGNPNADKKEIIAQGSLSATGLGEVNKLDTKVIPIEVGKWASIEIKVDYTLRAYMYANAEIIVSNNVDGSTVNIHEDVETRHNQIKTGEYNVKNGVKWMTAEVNNIMDIYKHIGDNSSNWGSLQDNKTNIITITAKRLGSGTIVNSIYETVGTVATYTITGIRR